MSFTIIQRKEGRTPARPLFLVSITTQDGDTVNLTTMASTGAASITYNGNTYLCRLQQNDMEAMQSTGSLGYSSLAGARLIIADADRALWVNHCNAHCWRGATVTITAVLYDFVAGAYSTDALQWSFIGGNPSYKNNSISYQLVSAINTARIKVPSIPLQYRCPWDFPATLQQRLAGRFDPSSTYYQCGYSADCGGGVGNPIATSTLSASLSASATTATIGSVTGTLPAVPFQATLGGEEELLVTAVSGSTLTIERAQDGTPALAFGSGTSFVVPFTTCDYTRSGGAPSGANYDPSVGCMARQGNSATTSIAPDGDLCHDKSGRYTGRFGGVTWVAPTQYAGKAYLSGQKTFGFNTPNGSLVGTYYNRVHGTQYVNAQALAPAADPNSLRSEVAICDAPFGAVTVKQLLINGVIVTQGNSDQLFTWRFASNGGDSGGAGGRSGSLQGDAIFNKHGDPHGSIAVLEFVVPAQLASAGSNPSVQVLVTSGPILCVYEIASIASGVVTLTGVCWEQWGASVCKIVGNSNASLNSVWGISGWSDGTPGTITLGGSAGSLSGSGGAIFVWKSPDLYDTGGSLSTGASNNVVSAGPAANPVFVYLHELVWASVPLSRIDAASWYAAAQICAINTSYIAGDGSTQNHAQYKCSLVMSGSQRTILSQFLTALRNAANLMVGENPITGLISCFIKQTLADQQPSAIPGSNDLSGGSPIARSSVTAAGSSANGYYAYVFNEGNIEPNTFEVVTDDVNAAPNTVAFQFQDENNGYVQDSLTEIDAKAYALSGNQEINVPIPIAGIPNFDQGTRVANVQLAETLYGNPRNDAGGTQKFRFRINHRVIHLTSRLGYICGLVWQPLGIGSYANPQPVRVIDIKPDTDGEHWDVTVAWHNDEWYTIAYGQNPTPYQNNPIGTPTMPFPYPWRAGQTVWGSGDAMFPNSLGFAFSVDTSSYPAKIAITGATPTNTQQSAQAPLIPLQGTTANTGGSIAPGTYHLAVSWNGSVGPVSSLATVVVPSGTSTNTLSLGGITWRGGAAPAPAFYIGRSSFGMRLVSSANYSTSGTDANGNPTSVTITAYADGLGLPDILANQFLVEEFGIIHGGVWGDTITGVDGTGTVLTFADGSWTTNQWAGRVLSLYYRAGQTAMPALNMAVASSTSDTLTMPSTGFQVGDVVVMRTAATTYTSNTIGDANFVNSYAPSGLIANAEVGKKLQIIAGTGAGYPPHTISGNTSTVYTIEDTFHVTPDATSIFVVLDPQIQNSYETGAFTGGSAAATIATTQAVTTNEQSLMVFVSTADASGNAAPRQYQPFREVYIPPQSILSSSVTLSIAGTLAIGSDLAPRIATNTLLTAISVQASVKNAPTGAALAVQIYYYSGSAWVTWLAISIAAGTTSTTLSGGSVSAAAQIPAGAYIRVDITGAGTTFPGSDLTVQIFF